MSDGTYLRAQARRCFHLSQQCYDLTVAEQLRILSENFDAKARDLDIASLRRRRGVTWSGVARLVERLRALSDRLRTLGRAARVNS